MKHLGQHHKYSTGQKKRNRDVMTCHDKSLPSSDGRSSQLWCKNRSQLVAFGIIHEIMLARILAPLRDLHDLRATGNYVRPSRRRHAPRCHNLHDRKLRVRSRRLPGLGLTVTTSLTVTSSAQFVSCKGVALQSAACDGGLRIWRSSGSVLGLATTGWPSTCRKS